MVLAVALVVVMVGGAFHQSSRRSSRLYHRHTVTRTHGVVHPRPTAAWMEIAVVGAVFRGVIVAVEAHRGAIVAVADRRGVIAAVEARPGATVVAVGTAAEVVEVAVAATIPVALIRLVRPEHSDEKDFDRLRWAVVGGQYQGRGVFEATET